MADNLPVPSHHQRFLQFAACRSILEFPETRIKDKTTAKPRTDEHLRKRCYAVRSKQRSQLEVSFPHRLNRNPPFSALSKHRFKPRHMLEPRLRLGKFDPKRRHQASFPRQFLAHRPQVCVQLG